MIIRAGLCCGVAPRLISERLLSDLDKNDMMQGVLDFASLKQSVEVWKASGMPNYAKGETKGWEELPPAGSNYSHWWLMKIPTGSRSL